MRSIDGEVEVINAGSQAGTSWVSLGTCQWKRLSYRAGLGYLFPKEAEQYPLDGDLTAMMQCRRLFQGRHYTSEVQITEQKVACKYCLGVPYKQEIQINAEGMCQLNHFRLRPWIIEDSVLANLD